MERKSVQPEWCTALPLQMQSVLFLAGRGPDGAIKHHPCKAIHVAYRGCVFLAGKYGRELRWGEKADSFMSLDGFADDEWWDSMVRCFFDSNGDLAHHYLLHFYHGAEILGYKHPDPRYRARWHGFYLRACEAMHINPETEAQMDERLGDWDRKHW